MRNKSGGRRWTGRVLFVLGLVAPILLSVAAFPVWYEARTDGGFLYISEGGLERGYGQAALGCAVAYIVLSMLLRRYLVLASILLSLTALGATVLAREFYSDFARLGETTTSFNVALAVAASWSAQSLLTLMLWRTARASVPKTLSTIVGTPRSVKNARLWHPQTVDRSLRSASVERWTLGIGLAFAAAAVVGAFGPWIKASSGLVSVSVSGTDGSNDGWVVVVAAGIGAASLVASLVKDSIRLMLLAFLAGVASAGVTWYDRHNAQETIGDTGDTELFAQIGWGLNLALVASIGMAISALVLCEAQGEGFAPPTLRQPTHPRLGNTRVHHSHRMRRPNPHRPCPRRRQLRRR